VKFIITNVTEKGFEIRINQVAQSEIPFAWQAMTVRDVQTSQSEEIITIDNAEVLPLLPSIPTNVNIPSGTAPTESSTVVSEPVVIQESIPSSTAPIITGDM